MKGGNEMKGGNRMKLIMLNLKKVESPVQHLGGGGGLQSAALGELPDLGLFFKAWSPMISKP